MRSALLLLTVLVATAQDPPRLPPLPVDEVPDPTTRPASRAQDEARAPDGDATAPGTRPGSRPASRAAVDPTDPDRLPRNPLMGVWRVAPSSNLGAGAGRNPTGYLVFTRTHLSIHLSLDRGDQAPMFQDGMRVYAIEGNQLVTTALAGHRSAEEAGRIIVDPVGHREVRQFALLAPNHLRLIQPGNKVLEFTRVERL
ncbi:MAG: hypothetical protein R3F30_05810 [Planctomycetota bacterium]